MKPMESQLSKYLSLTFPVQSSLKQDDALTSLLFTCASEYTIRNVHESRVGLKLKRPMG
jgi:hypothetical protein